MAEENKYPDYLRMLPGIYAQSLKDPRASDFLKGYLKIFEGILTGTEGNPLTDTKGIGPVLDPDVVGNLFYPRFSFLFPQTNTEFIPSLDEPIGSSDTTPLDAFYQLLGVAVYGQTQTTDYSVSSSTSSKQADHPEFEDWLSGFVDWLGSWFTLELSSEWDLEKKRTVVAESLPLYRTRGTIASMQQILLIWLSDSLADLWKNGSLSQSFGYTQLVTTDDTLLLIDGNYYATMDAYGLFTPIPAVTVGTYTLGQTYQTDQSPLIGGDRPFFFSADLFLPTYNNPQLAKPGQTAYDIELVEQIIQTTQTLLDQQKTGPTTYQINIVPTMQVGVIATLGSDTLLGAVPSYAVKTLQLGIKATLGGDTWLGSNSTTAIA